MKKTGTIKWFSQKKKYGFIVDDDNNTFFFHQDKVINPIDYEPSTRDIVDFETFPSKRGERAKDISLKVLGESNKFKCPSCKEDIIPKIIEKRKKRNLIIRPIVKCSVCENCNYEIEEHIENEEELTFLLFKVLFVITLLLITGCFFF